MNIFLKNLKTNQEIQFQFEPSDLTIQKIFKLSAQSYLKRKDFHLSYQGSSPQVISAAMYLDSDQDKSADIQKFFVVMDSFADIDVDLNLPPQVSLRFGKQEYLGHILEYSIIPLRMKESVLSSLQLRLQLQVSG